MTGLDPLVSLWKDSTWAWPLQNGRCRIRPYFGQRSKRWKVERFNAQIDIERKCSVRVRCALTSSPFKRKG